MNGLTGTVRLIRLALRRDRVTLPAWVFGLTCFLAVTTAMFEDQYSEHPDLLGPDTRIVLLNPGMRVLGLVTGSSVGAYTLHRDGLTLAVLAAVMSVLAVVRHTRQAEELGREELLAAGVVGRFASVTAAVVVALVANVALAVLLGAGMVLAGQPVTGSLTAGASIALVGVVFTGVAAVTAQVASTTRGAIGLASAVLGASFALAALGNMLGTVDSVGLRVTSAWPAWVSPIGWSQQVRPFADNAWWPVGLAAAALVALFGTAVVLIGRRDVGRGMWPERAGAAHASPSLVRPTGLVWRLQRGALAGWATGMLGFGLVFGALSDQIQGLAGEATEWYDAFGGDVDLVGAYWASMMQIAGTAVGTYVATLLLRLHHDETRGMLEPLLGTAISRLRWLGAYAVNALVGAVLLMIVFAAAAGVVGGQVLDDTPTSSLLRDLGEAALVQVPAIGVLGSLVVVAIMTAPRSATALAWVMVTFSIAVGPMFGPSLGLPAWLRGLSPFTHVPNAPVSGAAPGPLLGLAAVCVLSAVAGAVLLRRRDLALPV